MSERPGEGWRSPAITSCMYSMGTSTAVARSSTDLSISFKRRRTSSPTVTGGPETGNEFLKNTSSTAGDKRSARNGMSGAYEHQCNEGGKGRTPVYLAYDRQRPLPKGAPRDQGTGNRSGWHR